MSEYELETTIEELELEVDGYDCVTSFGKIIKGVAYAADIVCTAYYTPGDKGQLSGPPERCYPPEPDQVDVYNAKTTCVYIINDDGKTFESRKEEHLAVVDKWLASSGWENEESTIEWALEQGSEEEVARYEAAMEDKFEAMRERRR